MNQIHLLFVRLNYLFFVDYLYSARELATSVLTLVHFAEGSLSDHGANLVVLLYVLNFLESFQETVVRTATDTFVHLHDDLGLVR